MQNTYYSNKQLSQQKGSQQGIEFVSMPAHRISADLKSDGYSFIPGQEIQNSFDLNTARNNLIEIASLAPPDPHTKKPGRKRFYQNWHYDPTTNILVPRALEKNPHTGILSASYKQDLNPEHPGETRYFHPFPYSIQENAFLLEVIRQYFHALPDIWDSNPVLVGTHLITLRPEVGESAISSPNSLHQDGEPFTYISLLHRSNNIEGGDSFVSKLSAVGKLPSETNSDEEILFHTTLTQVMDTIVVRDGSVAHYVSPVTAVSEYEPYPAMQGRTVLLVDYTPFKPYFE